MVQSDEAEYGNLRKFETHPYKHGNSYVMTIPMHLIKSKLVQPGVRYDVNLIPVKRKRTEEE